MCKNNIKVGFNTTVGDILFMWEKHCRRGHTPVCGGLTLIGDITRYVEE